MNTPMEKIESALNALPVSTLSYSEWVIIGMALKHEGCPVELWDTWSQPDSRYVPGECYKKWQSFRENRRPATVATIFRLAQDRGWQAPRSAFAAERVPLDAMLPADEVGTQRTAVAAERVPLDALLPADEVGTQRTAIAAERVPLDAMLPADEVGMQRTAVAAERVPLDALLPADEVHTPSSALAPERVPLDAMLPADEVGMSRSDAQTSVSAAPLCESVPAGDAAVCYAPYEPTDEDFLALYEQQNAARQAQDAASFFADTQASPVQMPASLPQVAPFQAQNAQVSPQLSCSQAQSASESPQNPNFQVQSSYFYPQSSIFPEGNVSFPPHISPSLLNQVPSLPSLVNLGASWQNLPPLPEPLIEGILRRGHKMLLSGSSKAGKSFLLMELCIAIAEGKEWLGFRCRQGRVLYINLEIDPASCLHRFHRIYEALKLPPEHADDLVVWNWRGHALPMDQMTPAIIAQAQAEHFDAIVIDPIYKVITGDENNAADMGAFCNEFDKICDATGCATIYCHHHSKGAQGMKKAMDRASGSGVFARDPDAQLDMIQLELTDIQKACLAAPGATAWRLESSLREFPNFTPVNFWFNYPIHRVDTQGSLRDSPMEGTVEGTRVKSGKLVTPKARLEALDLAYQSLHFDKDVRTKQIADFLQISPRTLRDWVKEARHKYRLQGGFIYPVKPGEPIHDDEDDSDETEETSKVEAASRSEAVAPTKAAKKPVYKAAAPTEEAEKPMHEASAPTKATKKADYEADSSTKVTEKAVLEAIPPTKAAEKAAHEAIAPTKATYQAVSPTKAAENPTYEAVSTT